MELLITYVLLIFVSAARSFRREQTRTFEELGRSAESLPPADLPRIRIRTVLAPALAFALIAPCGASCVSLFFRNEVPRKFCPPMPYCWSTGPEACAMDCLPVDGVVAALPVDANEVVALREFALEGDVAETRRVWAFERFTRSGQLIIRSFMIQGTDQQTVKLEPGPTPREFKALLQTEEGVHGFHVRVWKGDSPDRATSHTFRTTLPDSHHVEHPDSVTVQIPLWVGSPRQLVPVKTELTRPSFTF